MYLDTLTIYDRRADVFSSPTVCIQVEGKDFHIHSDLVHPRLLDETRTDRLHNCHCDISNDPDCNSRFLCVKFDKDKEWDAARERTVALPDKVSRSAFAAYVRYLYLDPRFTDGAGTNELAELYVLGEWLRDVKFQNRIATALVQTLQDRAPNVPDPACVGVMYDGTPKGSHGRKIFVDGFVSYNTPEEPSSIEAYHPDFITDLAKALFLDYESFKGGRLDVEFRDLEIMLHSQAEALKMVETILATPKQDGWHSRDTDFDEALGPGPPCQYHYHRMLRSDEECGSM